MGKIIDALKRFGNAVQEKRIAAREKREASAIAREEIRVAKQLSYEEEQEREYLAFRRREIIWWCAVLLISASIAGLGFHLDHPAACVISGIIIILYWSRDFLIDIILYEISQEFGCPGMILFGIFLIGSEHRRQMRQYAKIRLQNKTN